jgi:hypothetical protein
MAYGMYGQIRYVHGFCWRNLKNRQLGGAKHREEDNIKMDLTGWEGMPWINLAMDRENWLDHLNTGNETSSTVT